MGFSVGIDATNIRGGGGLTHLVEVLTAAHPSDHGVDHVTIWAGENTISRLPDRFWLSKVCVNGIDKVPSHRRVFQQAQSVFKERINCDLLFAPGGVYLGKFRPFVSMSRNLLPFDAQERGRFGFGYTRFRYALLRLAQARTFRQAAGVIFLTEGARRSVESTTGKLPGLVDVIPHGVNPTFEAVPKRVRELESYSHRDPFRWLYVSRVSWYKHQWHVAHAIANLRRDGYPVHLDLIGPAYPPALKRLSRSLKKIDSAGEFIHYYGAVPYDELRKYYARADAFVFASSCETFGQTLTEAMRSGLPIACSNRSVLPEILQNAGEYFDPLVPESITAAMHRLMTDTVHRGRSAHLAQKLSGKYSWSRCAAETFAFIKRVKEDYERRCT